MKWNAIRLAAITTAILFGWLRLQGEGLITATSPLGIVDLELADTPSRLSALLLAWNKTIAVNNILIDFYSFHPMPCSYHLAADSWQWATSQVYYLQSVISWQRESGWPPF
jgi:hypothetical protein